MGAKLQSVLALHEIEQQICDIRRRIARKEKTVATQSQKLDTARQALQAEHEQIKRAQVHFNEQDHELKGRTGNLEKLREQLNSVRTNKEYAAGLSQLNNEKADVAKLELQALQSMEDVEKRKKLYAEHESASKAEAVKLEHLKSDLEQTRATYAARLKALEDQRKLAVANVEADVVKMFDRLSSKYDGEALAEVSKPNPRREEYNCGGCFMSLAPEVVNQLKTRDEIQTCKSCGRILVVTG